MALGILLTYGINDVCEMLISAGAISGKHLSGLPNERQFICRPWHVHLEKFIKYYF